MNTKNLRRAYSDISFERRRNIHENDDEQEQEGEQEVKQVRCDCCGIEEDCTEQYIDKIRYLYSGKWVCGLCSEVVMDRCRKNPPAATGMQEALDWHRGICEAFNSTARVNPKLHFARTMREIAKRSSQKRAPDFLTGSKISRSISCDPRLEGLM